MKSRGDLGVRNFEDEAVQRRIIGFHQDEEQHWVADLECGHSQHVRHDPPWQNRPWVLTEESRARFIGVELTCVKCDVDRVDSGH